MKIIGALALCLSSLAVACESRVEVTPPNNSEVPPPKLATVDKVDILLVVDNSREMADKEDALALSIADLVARLPVSDVHVGVISSSLGAHGGDACSDPYSGYGDDRAYLLSRTLDGEPVDTGGQGFLVWDPADPSALARDVARIVRGAGQDGCGFESQLEAMYRFLVDPAPYEAISVVDEVAVLEGTDTVLLEQRARFLRPDSALAIVLLSDENDCSVIDGGQNFYAARLMQPSTGTPFHLPRARAVCAVEPNDPCCTSCGLPAPAGCPEESCGTTTEHEDRPNLRCFDQKRRFGIDFLQPLDRYMVGLTSTTVADRDGAVQPNPLFAIRDPGLVFFTVITGVPSEDVARDPADPTRGIKDAVEMADASGGFSTWDAIIGKAPLDPLMRPAVDPRTGTNPYTGQPLAFEREVPGNDDLQYACLFELAEPRDCADGSCDECSFGGEDSPLCAPNPADGGAPTLQRLAKAYPGARQIELAHSLGNQAVVASICPTDLVDPQRDDYAYRQAMAALVERMRPRLSH